MSMSFVEAPELFYVYTSSRQQMKPVCWMHTLSEHGGHHTRENAKKGVLMRCHTDEGESRFTKCTAAHKPLHRFVGPQPAASRGSKAVFFYE